MTGGDRTDERHVDVAAGTLIIDDGDASIDQDGALVVGHDITPNYGNWIEVALTGEKNPKAAVNTKVEVRPAPFTKR